MDRRVWRTILLPTVACLSLTGCGAEEPSGRTPPAAGSTSTAGDAATPEVPKLPATPEDSYRSFAKALAAGNGPALCALIHPSAHSKFLSSANRANDRGAETCEDAVFTYASERTLSPVPKGVEIPIFGKVTYANNMWAGLEKCHETDDGGFDTNAASLTWKKQAGGWIISDVDIWLGCGG